MNDKFGRELKDLRISVTDRCNFRCRYCMPEELYGEAFEFLKKDKILSFEEIVRLSKIFISLGVNKIRITGGEPLVRKNVVDLINSIHSINKNVDIAMTTNGYLLKKFAHELYESGLKRLTVSLDTLDDKIFKEMSGKNFKVSNVLEGIDEAVKVGFKNIKINSVIKKGVNESSIIDLVDYSRSKNHILRFIEYMDVGTLNSWDKKNVFSSKNIKEIISKKYNIKSIEKNYPSETSERYSFLDKKGEIGFISSITNPFCDNCTRARITADGKLVTCLFSNNGIDLKSLLRGRKTEQEITDEITKVWILRNDKYSLDRSNMKSEIKNKIEMFQTGG
ncbi:MAG: GTP 3',8-cyclase MoaA [Chloroflexi bacterium]|nr:GTP 3',8-cyclase MoaA [Chloroflexota bacterium]